MLLKSRECCIVFGRRACFTVHPLTYDVIDRHKQHAVSYVMSILHRGNVAVSQNKSRREQERDIRSGFSRYSSLSRVVLGRTLAWIINNEWILGRELAPLRDYPKIFSPEASAHAPMDDFLSKTMDIDFF